MDRGALAEIERLEAAGDINNPRYMELLLPNHCVQHILRMPLADWPDPVNRAFARLNYRLYTLMQGPSELGASGRLVDWDRTADLYRIEVPTLVIGATYDSMDPVHMETMAGSIPGARFHLCRNGSHMCMYDDQPSYFDALVGFIQDTVEASRR